MTTTDLLLSNIGIVEAKINLLAKDIAAMNEIGSTAEPKAKLYDTVMHCSEASLVKKLDEGLRKREKAIEDTYVSPSMFPKEIVLGELLLKQKLDERDIINNTISQFKLYDAARNAYHVPYCIRTDRPLFMDVTYEKDSEHASELFSNILTRVIKNYPLNLAQIIFIDADKRGGSLKNKLINLVEDEDAQAGGDSAAELCVLLRNENDIADKLKDLSDELDRLADKIARAGYDNIYSYNQDAKLQDKLPYKFLVLTDFPQGIDARTASLLGIVLKRAKNCGVSILMSHGDVAAMDNAGKVEYNNFINNEEFDIIKIASPDNGIYLCNYRNKEYTFYNVQEEVSAEYFVNMRKKLSEKIKIGNNFASFFDVTDMQATRDSVQGISLPFAVTSDGVMQELVFDGDTQAHGFISGSTGSGKTTLIHMLITSAIMNYTPDQLELWLVDYKRAEFRFYADNCPPHLKYVIADNSEEITYDFIRQLTEEKDKRDQMFKRAGSDVASFKAYCEKGYTDMPRLLVIVDECHHLSESAREDDKLRIEIQRLFSEVRAFGINILLSDQTYKKGLGGLGAGVESNLAVRVAMRNEKIEIEDTLKLPQINDAERDYIAQMVSAEKGMLMFKKEIHDDITGNQSRGIMARAIYADRETDIKKIIRAIKKKYANCKRQPVFYFGGERQPMDRSKILSFEKMYPCKYDEGERFYIGTPLGLRYSFYFNMRSGRGENILLVGPDQWIKYSVMNAIGACAGRYGYQIVNLGLLKSTISKAYPDFYEAKGNKIGINKFGEVCQFIGEKAALIDMYSDFIDEDEDDEEEENAFGKTIIIIDNMDALCEKMAASSISSKEEAIASFNRKKEKLAEMGGGMPAPSPAPADQMIAKMDQLSSSAEDLFAGLPDDLDIDALMKQMEEMTGGKLPDISSPATPAAPAAMADPIPATMAEAVPAATSEITAPANSAIPGMDKLNVKIPGYDARRDLRTIIERGYTCGIFVVCAMDSAAYINEERRLFTDNFRHRIVTPSMDVEQTRNILENTKVLAEISNNKDTSQAIYCYGGGREQAFRPYRFEKEQ